MLTPGPDHPIRLEPATQRWRAFFNNHVIADTDDALILQESHLPPVVYFPREDVAMEYMGRTARETHCPYKGQAAYYTLTMGGQIAENVAWSYEDPFEQMGPIAERIAFYADRVEVYSVDDARVNPHHRRHADEVLPHDIEAVEQDIQRAQAEPDERDEIDEVIQHTDAGDGTSQRERWPPNLETPDAPDGGLR